MASSANALIVNKKSYKPGLNARGFPSRDVNRPEMDNRTFAGTNQQFKDACSAAGVQPTKRQASKFRRKLGAAFKAK